MANAEERSACEELLHGLVEWLKPLDTIDVLYDTLKLSRLRRIEAALLGMQEPKSQAQVEHEIRQAEERIEEQSHVMADASFWKKAPRDASEEQKVRKQREGEVRRLHWKEKELRRMASERERLPLVEGTGEALRTAFLKRSAELDQLGTQIALVEGRRNAAIRELERYRAAWHSQPKKEEIIDAEYAEAPADRPRPLRKHDHAAAARIQPSQRSTEYRTSVRARKGARKPERS
jgi:hypothetical protein